MEHNGTNNLVCQENGETDGYDNAAFSHHPDRQKRKKSQQDDKELPGNSHNVICITNGHNSIRQDASQSPNHTNGSAVVVVESDQDRLTTEEELNVNLNVDSNKELKCPLDTKLHHYVPLESEGKMLNSDDNNLRIDIPEDAVINFNTGRIRVQLQQNKSHSALPKVCQEDEEEKIPMQDMSPPSPQDDCEKALEASKNGKMQDDYIGDPVSVEKQGNDGAFDEYFVPVNTHKKCLRGEKLYLTKDSKNLCKNWRRVIVCGLIAIVIAVAILVGVLAATGILLAESEAKNTRHEGSGDTLPDVASISLAGSPLVPKVPQSNKFQPQLTTTEAPQFSQSVTQLTPKVPSPLPNVSQSHSVVPNALIGKFTIIDENFTHDLSDSSSYGYLSLATHLEAELSRIFRNNGGNLHDVKILQFSPGSIIVEYVVIWRSEKGVISSKQAHQIMRKYLKEHSNLFLAFQVNRNSLDFTDVVDECRNSKGGCEYDCEFNYITLEKTCICDEGMEITADGRTCGAKPAITTVSSTADTSIKAEPSVATTTTTEIPEITKSEITNDISMFDTTTAKTSSVSELPSYSGTEFADRTVKITDTTTSEVSFSPTTLKPPSSSDDMSIPPRTVVKPTDATPLNITVNQSVSTMKPKMFKTVEEDIATTPQPILTELATVESSHTTTSTPEKLPDIAITEHPPTTEASTTNKNVFPEVTTTMTPKIATLRPEGKSNDDDDDLQSDITTQSSYSTVKAVTTNFTAGITNDEKEVLTTTADANLLNTMAQDNKETITTTTNEQLPSSNESPVVGNELTITTENILSTISSMNTSGDDTSTLPILDNAVTDDTFPDSVIKIMETTTVTPVEASTKKHPIEPQVTSTTKTETDTIAFNETSTTVMTAKNVTTQEGSTTTSELTEEIATETPSLVTANSDETPVVDPHAETKFVEKSTTPSPEVITDEPITTFDTSNKIDENVAITANMTDETVESKSDNNTVVTESNIQLLTASAVTTEPITIMPIATTTATQEFTTPSVSADDIMIAEHINKSSVGDAIDMENFTTATTTVTPVSHFITTLNPDSTTTVSSLATSTTENLQTNHSNINPVSTFLDEATNATSEPLTTLNYTEDHSTETTKISTLSSISPDNSPLTASTEFVNPNEHMTTQAFEVETVTDTSTTSTITEALTALSTENTTSNWYDIYSTPIVSSTDTPTHELSNTTTTQKPDFTSIGITWSSSLSNQTQTIESSTKSPNESPSNDEDSNTTASIGTIIDNAATTISEGSSSSAMTSSTDDINNSITDGNINTEPYTTTTSDITTTSEQTDIALVPLESSGTNQTENTTIQESASTVMATETTPSLTSWFPLTLSDIMSTYFSTTEYNVSTVSMEDMDNATTTASYPIDETTFTDTTMPAEDNSTMEPAMELDEMGKYSTQDFDIFNSTLNDTAVNITMGIECREDQFLCTSLNTCLNNTVICDGIEDCPEGTDESDCTETCYSNFKCANSSTCIMNEAHCDDVWDCDDGSDEWDCNPTECAKHEVMCNDVSKCIKPGYICDWKYDCRDRSDEVGCVERTTCEAGGRFFCNDGLCIPWSLKCDGDYDCKDKEDEGNCTCLEDEFKCDDGKCLKSSSRCDGHRDCIEAEDEMGCVNVDENGIVSAFEPYSGSWSLICAEDWNLDDGHYLCQELGFGHALNTDTNHVSFNGTWMAMKRDNLTATSLWTERVNFAESCTSNLAASVMCQKFDCGNYSGLLHRRRRQADGLSSSNTQWPFIAYISMFQSPKGCLSEILTPVWLITSAECLISIGKEPYNGSDWYVRTNVAGNFNSDLAQNHEVLKIINHPHSSKFKSLILRDYDVALVRLKHALVFSDKIGAICLPEEQVPSGITCFSGVLGSEKPRAPPPESPSINSLAMMVMDRETCNMPDQYNNQVNNRMLCTKSSDSQSVCDSDGGTPLMCLSGPNKWYVAGMLSYQRFCGIYNWHPAVFSNLFPMRNFIDQVTGQKHYEVKYDRSVYIILPPTTIGPTEVTTETMTTEDMEFMDIGTTAIPTFYGSLDEVPMSDQGSFSNISSEFDLTEEPIIANDTMGLWDTNTTGLEDLLGIELSGTNKTVYITTTIGNVSVVDMNTSVPEVLRVNGSHEYSALKQPESPDYDTYAKENTTTVLAVEDFEHEKNSSDTLAEYPVSAISGSYAVTTVLPDTTTVSPEEREASVTHSDVDISPISTFTTLPPNTFLPSTNFETVDNATTPMPSYAETVLDAKDAEVVEAPSGDSLIKDTTNLETSSTSSTISITTVSPSSFPEVSTEPTIDIDVYILNSTKDYPVTSSPENVSQKFFENMVSSTDAWTPTENVMDLTKINWNDVKLYTTNNVMSDIVSGSSSTTNQEMTTNNWTSSSSPYTSMPLMNDASDPKLLNDTVNVDDQSLRNSSLDMWETRNTGESSDLTANVISDSNKTEILEKMGNSSKPVTLVCNIGQICYNKTTTESTSFLRAASVNDSDSSNVQFLNTSTTVISDDETTLVTENGTLATEIGTILVTENGTTLVNGNGTTLVTGNGTTLVAENAITVVTENGTAVVAENGTALVTENGTALVTENGTAVVTENGTALVTENGTALVTENGTASVTENGTSASVEPWTDLPINGTIST